MTRQIEEREARLRASTHSLLEKTSPSGHFGQVEEGDELSSVLLALSVLHDGNSERAEKDEAGELLHLLSVLALLDVHHVPSPSGGVEDGHRSSLGLEDPSQLLVVVGHHRGLLSLLARGVGEQTLDVLDGAEGLLPELEIDGRVELLEPGLQVSGEDVGVREVDGIGLVGVLVDGSEVLSDDLAESSELGLSSVLNAELEGLVDDLL